MKKPKKIEHVNKFSFALDYVKVEKKYLKYKKLQNITSFIGLGCASLVAALVGFGSLTSALTIGIFSSMVILPTLFVFNSVKRDIIENASNEEISFRQFRKMEKSGELKKLIMEVDKFNNSASVTYGIPKINQRNTTKQIYIKTTNLEQCSSINISKEK